MADWVAWCWCAQGCERSVITYSSLISACEKSGEWQLALRFFDECLKDNCRPNVITFNSLITACAQGRASSLQPATLQQFAVNCYPSNWQSLQ